MYSPRIISAQVDLLAAAFNLPSPREHSVAEVEAWTERLKDAVDQKGRPARELTKEELLFITNERIMTKASFIMGPAPSASQWRVSIVSSL